MSYKYIYINARSLVSFFGGAGKLSALFTKYGFEPVKQVNIYKWSERCSIPVDKWLQVEQIAIKEGFYVEMRKASVVIVDQPAPIQYPEEPLSSEEELL
ncbi:MAG: hypothetical protein V4721_00370 [Bacteroidota bacterium]